MQLGHGGSIEAGFVIERRVTSGDEEFIAVAQRDRSIHQLEGRPSPGWAGLVRFRGKLTWRDEISASTARATDSCAAVRATGEATDRSPSLDT